MVEKWTIGEPITAAHLNEMVSASNAVLRSGALGEAQFAGSGLTFIPTALTRLAIFELSEDITYPSPGDVSFPEGWDVPPDVPYAENCDEIQLYQETNVYQVPPGIVSQTVYFPTITDFTQGEPVARITGDRVEAVFNRQSGRWEGSISDHGGPFWGKTNGSLSKGSSQTVDIIDNTEATTGDSVTGYDRLLATGETIATGTKVLAQWIRSERRWYVTAAECE